MWDRVDLRQTAQQIETERAFQAALAAIHERAGRLMHLRGNQEEARAHFQQAVEIDPQGATGQVAREALAALKGAAPEAPRRQSGPVQEIYPL